MEKNPSTEVWDKFWAGKESASIYPPVTDIVDELSKITDLSNKTILEVGAGTGRDGLRLSHLENDVYLLDNSRESLRLVHSNIRDHDVRLILADGRCCPFDDNTFDIVFHQGLLEHFPKPYKLLEENFRILKKGGILVVDVPQTFHIYTVFKQVLIFFGLWFGGWERQFTRDSLRRLLEKFNFKIVHFYGGWSRPGILYKMIRELLKKIKITLPMYPKFTGPLTKNVYRLEDRLSKKKLFLYTVLSIGVIVQKN